MISIAQQLDAQLTSDAEVQVRTPHGLAAIVVADVDSLSCRIERIVLEPLGDLARTGRNWTEVAEAIVERVRYLAEPLTLLERDEESRTSLIRSANPPRAEDRSTCYFECLASPQAIELRRYLSEPGAGRRVVEFSMTRESLAQLLADMDAAGATEPTVPQQGRVRLS